jgi:hypothetical protein
MNSGHQIIKEYCKDIYKEKENKNAYLDLRNKLVFFIDKDNKVEIETMSVMLRNIVDNHMENINTLKSMNRLYRIKLKSYLKIHIIHIFVY